MVSLGEGVKNQISGQIGKLGNDLISVHPGNLVSRDEAGNITSVNLLSTLGSGTLSDNDLQIIKQAESIEQVAPLGLISGVPKTQDKKYSSSAVITTTSGLPEIISQDLAYGSFFPSDDYDSAEAVVGRSVALNLFNENVPIGKTVSIRGKEFIIRGVFEKFEINPVNPTLDLNNAIFIPLEAGKLITNDTHIFQILAKTDEPANAGKSVSSIVRGLKTERAGEEDFTVLKQDDTLAIANNIVRLITTLVAGVAAISLLIGGIGIMNIMLVSVSERKQEIGIRKAVGATNAQIMSQFLIEAVVLSLLGALLGLLVSAIGNIAIRIFTDLKPVITPQIVVIAMFVSVAVGAIFGLAPAVKAAAKDPIDSLRDQ
jgi:ABC-type antimicrobial peptide transport system permease subunit